MKTNKKDGIPPLFPSCILMAGAQQGAAGKTDTWFWPPGPASQDFPGGSVGRSPSASVGDAGGVSSVPGLGRPTGEGNGTHSSILAWEIPCREEPVSLQSMGL